MANLGSTSLGNDMVSYNFDAPDTDAVLRSSDGIELPVHRFILILASPVFEGMFSLPQSTNSAQIPTVDVSEPSHILRPFIQYLYPRSPPTISDLSMWEALYTIADKYSAEVVMDPLRDMLVHRFLETSPLRVYALASHWGFSEVAKLVSTRTLMIDIFKDLSREDAELMGGDACRRLFVLHVNRREAARGVITNHPLPSSPESSCECPEPDYSGFIPALYRILETRSSLTAEELYEDAGRFHYPVACSRKCRNTFQNVHKYFLSILKQISNLPQTI